MMKQESFYVAPTVKSITMKARSIVCTSPSFGSESFLKAEEVNLDDQ